MANTCHDSGFRIWKPLQLHHLYLLSQAANLKFLTLRIRLGMTKLTVLQRIVEHHCHTVQYLEPFWKKPFDTNSRTNSRVRTTRFSQIMRFPKYTKITSYAMTSSKGSLQEWTLKKIYGILFSYSGMRLTYVMGHIYPFSNRLSPKGGGGQVVKKVLVACKGGGGQKVFKRSKGGHKRLT